MAGLTDQGLEIKRLEDVISDQSEQAAVLFQDVVPPGDVVDTSAGTALGRIIGTTSPSYADLWEALEQVYNAHRPSYATGLSLDEVCAIGGVDRLDSIPTSGYVHLFGNYLTSIPSGSIVGSAATSAQFELQSTVVLNETGVSSIQIQVSTVTNSATYTITAVSGGVTRTFSYTADGATSQTEILDGLEAEVVSEGSSLFTVSQNSGLLVITSINPLTPWNITKTSNLTFSLVTKVGEVECTEVGPVEQGVGTVTSIATPVLGWTSVTNPVTFTTGRNVETDEELRLRFRNSKYIRGSSITEALQSDLLATPGVESVVILENDTNSTDGDGIPAHSYMPIVEGGLNQDIGDVIWANKPTGITSHGDITVSVVDFQGLTKSVKFQRPDEVLIYIDLEITDLGSSPDDVEDQIKAALVQYFIDNYGSGDDVIYTRLYTPINSVAGFEIDALTIGITASPVGTSNITIDSTEKPVLERANITITVN